MEALRLDLLRRGSSKCLSTDALHLVLRAIGPRRFTNWTTLSAGKSKMWGNSTTAGRLGGEGGYPVATSCYTQAGPSDGSQRKLAAPGALLHRQAQAAIEAGG